MRLTDEELAAAAELCADATPEPWMGPRITDQWPPGWLGIYAMVEGDPYEVVGVTGHWQDGTADQAKRDAAFIAASRTLVPRLLAENARMRPVVDAAVTMGIALKDENNECLAEHEALFGAVAAYREEQP